MSVRYVQDNWPDMDPLTQALFGVYIALFSCGLSLGWDAWKLFEDLLVPDAIPEAAPVSAHTEERA